jgi:cell wall-associated NlpC family hydrolase
MSKIIEVARKELGYEETPPDSNRTKYGAWFGLNGVAWCAIFVSWVYDQAGLPLGNIGFKKGMAGCQTAVAHFRKTGEITKTPKTGDIVFFDFNGDGRYDHVGIFVGYTGAGVFEAIEGNTSLKNNSNGGQVMTRLRNVRNALFVHPKVLDTI